MPGIGIDDSMLGKIVWRQAAAKRFRGTHAMDVACLEMCKWPVTPQHRLLRVDKGYEAWCQMVIRWILLFLERACVRAAQMHRERRRGIGNVPREVHLR